MKEKPDDRAELIATDASLVKEEGSSVAWIAKITSGAKGFAIIAPSLLLIRMEKKYCNMSLRCYFYFKSYL